MCVVDSVCVFVFFFFDFFFQAEDGIRDLVRSRGLGDVYKRQLQWGENAGSNRSVTFTIESIKDSTLGSDYAVMVQLSLIHI